MYMIYGIPNCDTVKKTLNWFKEHKLDHAFHDYKKKGISATQLKTWCRQLGWEPLLNKKGTTWRKLPEAIQVSITSEAKAIALMAHETSIIKRPVIERGDNVVTVGFDERVYREIFLP
ncbi:MAG: ArsC family reductase [Sediminibacterium sp.]